MRPFLFIIFCIVITFTLLTACTSPKYEPGLQGNRFKGDMKYAHSVISSPDDKANSKDPIIVARIYGLDRPVMFRLNGIPIVKPIPDEVPGSLVLSHEKNTDYNVLLSGPTYEAHRIKPGKYYVSLMKLYTPSKDETRRVDSFLYGKPSPTSPGLANIDGQQCYIGTLEVKEGEIIYLGDIAMTRPLEPNPFIHSTTIHYHIKNEATKAKQAAGPEIANHLATQLMDLKCNRERNEKE